MLTLFHAPWSRSSRLVWLLEELKADYAIRYCDIPRRDGTGARDPRNPHPDGKVPALMHDEALITESAAVTLYLTDLLPKARMAPLAGDPDRGAYLTWLAWNAGELEPAFWNRIMGHTETDPRARAGYDAAIARLMQALETGPWLMGQKFTAVDVLIGSALGWGRDYLPQSPLLDDYLLRLEARPANGRAAAKDGVPQQYAQAS